MLLFFTSMMDVGLPQELPVAVVDLDNSSTSRKLIRSLDAFQSTTVAAVYHNEREAREALETGKIYGYIIFPENMSGKMVSVRQPVISIYFNSAYYSGGTLAYKDLRTIATLAKAASGQAKLRAKGATEAQIETFLQPVKLDLHMIDNPWTNYNAFLSTTLVPGLIMMFVCMMSVYVLGEELRDGTAQKSLEKCGNNIHLFFLKKLLPVATVYIIMMGVAMYYFYIVQGFPHQGEWYMVMGVAILMVFAAQGFAVFLFGLCPHFRMALSICSLWTVLNISMNGVAFPVGAMHSILQALSYLFPLRYYFMAYQLGVFHGYPLEYTWIWIGGLIIFAALPLLTIPYLKKVFMSYKYIP